MRRTFSVLLAVFLMVVLVADVNARGRRRSSGTAYYSGGYSMPYSGYGTTYYGSGYGSGYYMPSDSTVVESPWYSDSGTYYSDSSYPRTYYSDQSYYSDRPGYSRSYYYDQPTYDRSNYDRSYYYDRPGYDRSYYDRSYNDRTYYDRSYYDSPRGGVGVQGPFGTRFRIGW